MKTTLALLLLASSIVAETRTIEPRPDTTRPPINMRDVVGIVPQGGALDVYWMHINEQERPVRSILKRTTIAADGRSRLSTAVIREDDGWFYALIEGEGTNVQAMLVTYDRILATPVVDGALKYPDGKLVAQYSLYPQFHCHGEECLVTYDWGPTRMAVFLDRDSNVVGSPIALPEGFLPSRVHFDERGIFYVRNTSTELRAALVRRDGSVQYDVPIDSINALQFGAQHMEVTHNGLDHVVMYLDRDTEPDQVRAVTISANGTVSEPTVLFEGSGSKLGNQIGIVSLAWNGSSYLAAVHSASHSPAVLQRFGVAFQPLGEPIFSTPLIRAIGGRFVLAAPWATSNARPVVSVMSEDGSLSPWLDIDPQGKRRSVR